MYEQQSGAWYNCTMMLIKKTNVNVTQIISQVSKDIQIYTNASANRSMIILKQSYNIHLKNTDKSNCTI